MGAGSGDPGIFLRRKRGVDIAALMRCFAMRTALVLILLVVPALAHHSFDAEYDASKTATLTGYVTKVDWVNPHAYIYFNMQDASGKTKEIRFELGPPYALVRGG